MISLEDKLTLHYLSIEEFGGAHGVRDEHLLLSAIARPIKLLTDRTYTIQQLQKQLHSARALLKTTPL